MVASGGHVPLLPPLGPALKGVECMLMHTVYHICQLSGISKSEIACETPIYRFFVTFCAHELFLEKIKSKTFFKYIEVVS